MAIFILISFLVYFIVYFIFIRSSSNSHNLTSFTDILNWKKEKIKSESNTLLTKDVPLERSESKPLSTKDVPLENYNSANSNKYKKPSLIVNIEKYGLKGASWVFSPENVFRENYVSYSRLNTYQTCPKRFELVYLCGIDEPTSKAAYFGSVVHRMLDLSIRDQINFESKQNSIISVDTIMSYFFKAQQIEGNKYLLLENEIKDYIVRFLILNKDINLLKTNKTEYEVSKKIAGYNVKCVIDRIDKGEYVTVIDYKTGNKDYITKNQLNLYALAIGADTNNNYKLQYQFLKTGEQISWFFSKQDSDDTLEWMHSTIHKIENASYFPKNLKLCRWCGLKSICK